MRNKECIGSLVLNSLVLNHRLGPVSFKLTFSHQLITHYFPSNSQNQSHNRVSPLTDAPWWPLILRPQTQISAAAITAHRIHRVLWHQSKGDGTLGAISNLCMAATIVDAILLKWFLWMHQSPPMTPLNWAHRGCHSTIDLSRGGYYDHQRILCYADWTEDNLLLQAAGWWCSPCIITPGDIYVFIMLVTVATARQPKRSSGCRYSRCKLWHRLF